ncbi:unnamed protein product, partial [Rotaria sordida]
KQIIKVNIRISDQGSSTISRNL